MILLNPNYKIEFTADPHGYLVDGVQKRYFSQIIRDAGIAKPYPKMRRIQQGAVRGTYIHHVCHLIAAGGVDWSSVHKEWIGYARAFESFWKMFGKELIMAEQPLYNEQLDYCSTPDIFFKSKSGKNILLEIKTGKMPDWAGVQLMANYSSLCKLLPDGKEVDGLVAIQLNKEGSFDLWSSPPAGGQDFYNLSRTWNACLDKNLTLIDRIWHCYKPAQRMRMKKLIIPQDAITLKDKSLEKDLKKMLAEMYRIESKYSRYNELKAEIKGLMGERKGKYRVGGRLLKMTETSKPKFNTISDEDKDRIKVIKDDYFKGNVNEYRMSIDIIDKL